MQCASSIAKKEMCWFCKNSSVRGETRRSGDMYNRRNWPNSTCCAIRRFSSIVSVLFTAAAGMPQVVSASTWSFMSANSGETTTASPSRHKAGAWKQSDLPPPVGMTTSESWSSITHCIASR